MDYKKESIALTVCLAILESTFSYPSFRIETVADVAVTVWHALASMMLFGAGIIMFMTSKATKNYTKLMTIVCIGCHVNAILLTAYGFLVLAIGSELWSILTNLSLAILSISQAAIFNAHIKNLKLEKTYSPRRSIVVAPWHVELQEPLPTYTPKEEAPELPYYSESK
jgi:hypothetical protein